MIKISFFILIFFFSFKLYAHEGLLKRISKISEEIKVDPDNAYLYLKRGKLYYYHHDFENSINDLEVSKKLGLKNMELNYYSAKNYFKLDNLKLSRRLISKILRVQPNNVKALELLGKIYFKGKKYEKSAKTFEQLIVLSKEPNPDNYLLASKAWYAINTKYGKDKAKSILINGIKYLGNNIVLYDKLIDINLRNKDFNSAIKLQKIVIDFSPRKERGSLKLATIFISQKNFSKANASIKIAKEHYNKLPQRIKESKFMKDFYSELKLKEQFLKDVNLN